MGRLAGALLAAAAAAVAVADPVDMTDVASAGAPTPLSAMVTVATKTMGRHHLAVRMIDSLHARYPGVHVIVVDDDPEEMVWQPMDYVTYLPLPFDTGLSQSRNVALEHVKTPYVLLLDDDFIFTDKSDLVFLRKVLDESDFDILGARSPVDEKKFKIQFRGLMSIEYGTLYLRPGYYKEEHGCLHVDFTPNLLFGRVDRMLEVRWDPDLKMGEHEDFFLRAKFHGLKVGSCQGIEFFHGKEIGTQGYQKLRRRVFDFWKIMLRRHYLWRMISFGWEAIQLPKAIVPDDDEGGIEIEGASGSAAAPAPAPATAPAPAMASSDANAGSKTADNAAAGTDGSGDGKDQADGTPQLLKFEPFTLRTTLPDKSSAKLIFLPEEDPIDTVNRFVQIHKLRPVVADKILSDPRILARIGDLSGEKKRREEAVNEDRLMVTVDNRPKVLLIPDRPNWSFDSDTSNTIAVLGEKYNMYKYYEVCPRDSKGCRAVTEQDIDEADYVVIYYWALIRDEPHLEAAFARNRHKLFIGICSFTSVHGAKEDEAIDYMHRYARGVFVNNLPLWRHLMPRVHIPIHYIPNGANSTFFQPLTDIRQESVSVPVNDFENIEDGDIPEDAKLCDGGRFVSGWAGAMATRPGYVDFRGVRTVIQPASRMIEGVQLRLSTREMNRRPHSEMPDFYKSLDVYTVASVSEGTPNPALEAAQTGLPILSTRVGNMNEFITEGVTGFFIERNATQLAARLKLLCNNRRLLNYMKVATHTLANRFWDWHYTTRTMAFMLELAIDADKKVHDNGRSEGQAISLAIGPSAAHSESYATPSSAVDSLAPSAVSGGIDTMLLRSGVLSGLSLLLHFEPSRIVILDDDELALDMARVIVHVARAASSPEEFVTMFFARNVTEFLAGRGDATITTANQGLYLKEPVDHSIAVDVLAQLPVPVTDVYRTLHAHRQAPVLVPVMDPRASHPSLFYGLGWLASRTNFERVTAQLHKVEFVPFDLMSNDEIEMLSNPQQKVLIHHHSSDVNSDPWQTRLMVFKNRLAQYQSILYSHSWKYGLHRQSVSTRARMIESVTKYLYGNVFEISLIPTLTTRDLKLIERATELTPLQLLSRDDSSDPMHSCVLRAKLTLGFDELAIVLRHAFENCARLILVMQPAGASAMMVPVSDDQRIEMLVSTTRQIVRQAKPGPVSITESFFGLAANETETQSYLLAVFDLENNKVVGDVGYSDQPWTPQIVSVHLPSGREPQISFQTGIDPADVIDYFCRGHHLDAFNRRSIEQHPDVAYIASEMTLTKLRPVLRTPSFGPVILRKPSVMVVLDSLAWAHAHKTRNIAQHLGSEYNFVSVLDREVTPEQMDNVDLILLYHPMTLEVLLKRPDVDVVKTALGRNRYKLLLGRCSHLFDKKKVVRTLATGRAVFANSMFLYREYEPLVTQPVYYTPNGVDTTFFHPSGRALLHPTAPLDDLRVGFVGRNVSRKGVPMLTEAVARLDGVRLEMQAVKYGGEIRPQEEIRDYYHSLDVYVCASDFEGTPNPALEAAASGVVVVTTRVGNMPELIIDGHNGLFVERTVEDIAAKLAYLRDNPEVLAAMKVNIRRSIMDWDWKHQVGPYRTMFLDSLKAIFDEDPATRDSTLPLPVGWSVV